MAEGFPELVVPRSTSEMHRMCNAARAHHRAMHGQVTDVAAALKSILPDVIAERGGTRAGFMGQDAKAKANRIIRPLMQAAALDDVIARLFVQSYNRYNDLVVKAPKQTGRRQFNADA